jgi:2-polyprenyl-3-methyl-5-hydroxy-6-metoxy-1,4-benzoquinol methylase
LNLTTELVDKIKQYWNTQPCNVKHSLSEPGTEQYWNEVTERRFYVEPHLRDFASFHLWRGKRVLEIGSGIGSDAVEFARHGAEYVGIDLSAESVAMSQQRFELFGLTGEFHVMDGADTESMAKLGKFDLVYSCGVLHHYPDMGTCLDNIRDALVPNGEFRMLVYAKNSWKYAMIQKGLDQFEAQAGCPYAKAYTKEEIYQLLDNRQLEVLRIRQDHNFMYNVPKYRQGEYELEPWFAAMPEEMRAAIKEYLGWHLLVKARKI